MRTTRKRPQGRVLGALTMALALALLAALLLAGAAMAAAKPGTPTANAPKGSIATTTPSFAWSKAKGAARYELRVYQGSTQVLKMSALTRLSCKSGKALPTNVALTWKVRAGNAAGDERREEGGGGELAGGEGRQSSTLFACTELTI